MPYKNITFAKLEKRLFNDPRWYMMSEKAQLNFIKMILFACETYNKIPKDYEAIKKAFKTDQTIEEIEETIKEIKSNFPKFRENKRFFYFLGFDEKTNYIPRCRKSQGNPKEITGKSQGNPWVKEREKEKERSKEKEKEKEEEKEKEKEKDKEKDKEKENNINICETSKTKPVDNSLSASPQVAEDKPPPPGVKDFLSFFGNLWKEGPGKGKTYPASFGKEGKIIKDLLKIYKYEELCELARQFFSSTDEFVTKSGYTIGAFKVVLPKLVIEKSEVKYGEIRRNAWRARQELNRILAGG